MEVKKPNKEIPIHSNFFNHNNPPSSLVAAEEEEEEEKTSTPTPTLDPSPTPRAEMIRYRECQRNHAAHLGSHVVDGCGEFMPSGEGDSPLALKCAACGCHRNFHKREVEGETITTTAATATAPASILPLPPSMTTTNCYISLSKYHHKNNLSADNNFTMGTNPPAFHHPRTRAPVMMEFGGGGAAAESSSDELNAYRAGNFDYGGQFVQQYGVSKKRFRTKFNQEQKDKMMEFAGKIGWKIQKQDNVQVQQFCHDVGVKRQVFKVWMHNNKQSMKKKQV